MAGWRAVAARFHGRRIVIGFDPVQECSCLSACVGTDCSHRCFLPPCRLQFQEVRDDGMTTPSGGVPFDRFVGPTG